MAFLSNDTELLSQLSQISQIFESIHLEQSSYKINEIYLSLYNHVGNITRTSFHEINKKFIDLQTLVETEFASDTHRTECQKLFLKTLRYNIKIHLNEIKFVVNTKPHIDLVKQRKFAIHNLLLLRKIIYECAKTDDEKAVGISQIYLSLTEGGYRNALREYLVWHLIRNEKDFSWIVFSNYDYCINMLAGYSIFEIKEYFKKRRIDQIYFEGWNSTIRNAVAHSTYHYEKTTKTIIYEVM